MADYKFSQEELPFVLRWLHEHPEIAANVMENEGTKHLCKAILALANEKYHRDKVTEILDTAKILNLDMSKTLAQLAAEIGWATTPPVVTPIPAPEPEPIP